MLIPIKEIPICTEEALEALREYDYSILETFYLHSNDPVQKILIEIICDLKEWKLPTSEFNSIA